MFRVKRRNNPWFSLEISHLLQKGTQNNSEADWLGFRQLRNKFTLSIKTAKSEFYLSNMTINLKAPNLLIKEVKHLIAINAHLFKKIFNFCWSFV